jgi:DNA-entry nuclease
MMKSIRTCLLPLLLCCLVLTGCQGAEAQTLSFSLEDVPAYSGEPYVVLDGNEPAFSQEDRTSTTSFESYSPLDALGRCGTAYANVGTDLMPTEDRGDIGQVKPTGWHTVKYDCVDGKYLYNRCHLIGYQLTGENANEENLITGTRYLNVEGMLPFEDLVADYVQETDNHVLYRVTPVFEGDNLVASGVQMEGWSVEDEGEGVCFNVYVYNVQPGVTIDYATGESALASDVPESGTANPETAGEDSAQEQEETTYILNTSSRKFHLPDCSSVSSMKEENKSTYTGSREDLIEQGYEPCGQCKP